ncbi:hypothetical protein FRB99_004746 [Tulasnella sp. 403]|nr:hypothetical protein FRB99_004746 [Tulasnella sp. 403]
MLGVSPRRKNRPRLEPGVRIAGSHPIARLPPELLVYVFKLGSAAEPSTFPTLVSQGEYYIHMDVKGRLRRGIRPIVCGSWRELALNTCSLWAYFDYSGANPKAKAKLWAKRSRQAPIHICFSVDDGFDPDLSEMESAMRIALRHVSRWGRLTLHLDPEPLKLALEMCDVAAPCLTHLSIRCTEVDAIEEQFVLFNERTPLLKSVDLSGVPVPWTGPLFNNLEELRLGYYEEESSPSLEQVTDILHRCPALQVLMLDRTGITTYSTFHPATLTLHSLKFVQMTQLDREVYFWMVAHFRGPNVQTYIGNPGQHSSDPEVKEMIQTQCHETPFPNVVRLRTQYAKVYPVILNKIYNLMERLAVIEFYQCFLSDDVIVGLVWSLHHQKSRDLRILHLEECQGFSVDILKEIVTSRCEPPEDAPVRKLDSLRVLKCSSLDLDNATLEWFRERVREFMWTERTLVSN